MMIFANNHPIAIVFCVLFTGFFLMRIVQALSPWHNDDPVSLDMTFKDDGDYDDIPTS